MSRSGCHRESEVLSALETDAWSIDLREHLGTCEACSDLIVVARALASAAEDLEPDSPLPDPGKIWWRAQTASRAAAATRATRIITVMQWLAVVVGSAAALGIIAWALPALRDWLSVFGNLGQVVRSGAASPSLVIAASAIILLVMVFLDMNTEWVRPRSRG